MSYLNRTISPELSQSSSSRAALPMFGLFYNFCRSFKFNACPFGRLVSSRLCRVHNRVGEYPLPHPLGQPLAFYLPNLHSQFTNIVLSIAIWHSRETAYELEPRDYLASRPTFYSHLSIFKFEL